MGQNWSDFAKLFINQVFRQRVHAWGELVQMKLSDLGVIHILKLKLYFLLI